MQVTLAKALKLKNRQVRAVTELQRKIDSSNSHLVGSEPDFDAKALYERLKVETETLVKIKAAINAANAPIQETIYRMAETKGMILFLQRLSTERGKVASGYMMSEPQEYEAHITAVDVDEEVQRLEKLVDELQDSLDAHNATVRIELTVPE